MASATGVYLHLLWNIGGLLTVFAMIGSMVWLLATPSYEEVPSLSLLLLLLLMLFIFSRCFVLGADFLFLLDEQKKRVSLLMATALFKGASIGPLIDLAIQIDPRYPISINVSNIYSYTMFVSVMFSFCLIDVGVACADCNFFLFCFSILISAFVGTGLAFACFSVAAMVARRREYLYLGGLLSSGLSMLLWLHFASSIFGGSTAIFKFEVRGC